MMPRPVMKSPGTCSVRVGSSEGWYSLSIRLRSTTEMVIGRRRMSVWLRVPVTTTSAIGWTFSPRTLSAGWERTAHSGARLPSSSMNVSLVFMYSRIL